MTPDQVKLAYEALTKSDRGRTASAVAKETGLPLTDIERLVAFIKTSPLFEFTLSSAGLLNKLNIPRLAPGVYCDSRDRRGVHIFYAKGKRVAYFEPSEDPKVVRDFEVKHRAEAQATGALYYPPYADERIDIVASRVAECLAVMPA